MQIMADELCAQHAPANVMGVLAAEEAEIRRR
jgi:hypothetical protein